MNTKHQLRQHLRQKRKALTPQQRQQAEHQACTRLSRFIKRGQRLAIYWAVGSELNLNAFINKAQKRKAQLYLPYIETPHQRLWFTPYVSSPRRPNKLKPNPFHIPQFSGKKIRAHQLHRLIIPLIGIDKSGYRLGQGGGFYDVSLAHCRHRHTPQTIGIGFSCQRTDTVFPETHDSRLHYFVDEHNIEVFTS